MLAKNQLRKRVLSYVVLAAVFIGWFLVTDYLDREQQERIAALREMHRQGRALDIDAILSDPKIRRQKRLVNTAVLLVAVVGALEWRHRRQAAIGKSPGKKEQQSASSGGQAT